MSYGSAFKNCDCITSVTIPDSVTYIGDSIFSNCDKISALTMYYNGYLSDIMDDYSYKDDVLTGLYTCYSFNKLTPTFIDLNGDSQDIPWSDFFGGSGSGSGSGY